jgi:cob(I)alamin adenosyltransferase
MKLSKIYTKSGDKGMTSLIGGERVSKSNLHLEAYGTSDELNAQIGVIRTLCLELKSSDFKTDSLEDFRKIQNDLFDLGSFLAMGNDSSIPIQSTDIEKRVSWMEQRIDVMNESLGELRSFTLPGGCMINAHAHIARTVCRRLERACYRLKDAEGEVDTHVLAYINRLSDYLFVYSRFASLQLNADEFLWDRPLQS